MDHRGRTLTLVFDHTRPVFKVCLLLSRWMNDWNHDIHCPLCVLGRTEQGASKMKFPALIPP